MIIFCVIIVAVVGGIGFIHWCVYFVVVVGALVDLYYFSFLVGDLFSLTPSLF